MFNAHFGDAHILHQAFKQLFIPTPLESVGGEAGKDPCPGPGRYRAHAAVTWHTD